MKHISELIKSLPKEPIATKLLVNRAWWSKIRALGENPWGPPVNWDTIKGLSVSVTLADDHVPGFEFVYPKEPSENT